METTETTTSTELVRRADKPRSKAIGTLRKTGVVLLAGAFVSSLALPAAAFSGSQNPQPHYDSTITALLEQQSQSVSVSESALLTEVATAGLSATTPEELEQLRAEAAAAEEARLAEQEAAREATGSQSATAAAAMSSTNIPANSGAVGIAASQIGVPYVFGGASPATGFDCSGFTQWVYAQAAGVYLPHSALAQARYGAAVAPSDIQPGDLVVWGTGHSGVYAGNNSIIHAATPGTLVKYSSYSAMVAAFGTPEIRRF